MGAPLHPVSQQTASGSDGRRGGRGFPDTSGGDGQGGGGYAESGALGFAVPLSGSAGTGFGLADKGGAGQTSGTAAGGADTPRSDAGAGTYGGQRLWADDAPVWVRGRQNLMLQLWTVEKLCKIPIF